MEQKYGKYLPEKKNLFTEMDVLRRSAEKCRIEK
jgi:hypothetical protein